MIVPACLTVLLVFCAPSYGANARLVDRHTAIAPAKAPKTVKRMIRAANRISRLPYVWGGGHGSFKSRGYDCSGAVSYVLRAGRYLRTPLTSGSLSRWGRRGKNRWVTVYANRGHVYMVIAGLRFDTSYLTDGDSSGPGWSKRRRPSRGFAVRSPRGLTNAAVANRSGGITIRVRHGRRGGRGR